MSGEQMLWAIFIVSCAVYYGWKRWLVHRERLAGLPDQEEQPFLSITRSAD